MLPTVAFLSACGVRPDVAVYVLPGLVDVIAKYGIGASREALAGFIGESMHESMLFTKMAEDMTYSSERLMVVWPHRFPTHDIADQYAHNPQKLANLVYAGRNGNGDVASGDGFAFRGTGWLQTTGKSNFIVARTATGVDYVSNPDMGRKDPWHAAALAGCFWFSNGFNTLITAAGIDAVTHKINPYDSHEASENRRTLYARAFSCSQQLQP